jgi:UDP-N-acetylglucosamine:LPS N-acetylglucosamine transferase
MNRKRILFISWQGGLGHVTRDLAIVKELHRLNPEIDIKWLAHPLATHEINLADETLLPESELSADYNKVGMQAMNRFSLNLMKYVRLAMKAWGHNADLFRQVIDKYDFDLVIGDECYEVIDDMAEKQIQMKCPMIIIEDFIGAEAMSKNPLEKLGIYLRHRSWILNTQSLRSNLSQLFVGEIEDVPDKTFGFLLPNRREFAKENYHFLGHIIRFDPADYTDKAKIRKKLGYGENPLIICATGGTSAGKEMLEICGKAYTILKKEISDLEMICVCGELFDRKPPALPSGVTLFTHIPDLHEHYAACDMAVVVGGGTTTTELTALKRPFIYFPLENQFDQQLYVADRLNRHNAGIKMEYAQTTPELLALTIKSSIFKKVDYKQIDTTGAQKAASFINQMINDDSPANIG